MDPYMADLTTVLELITETANANARTTRDMLLDLSSLLDQREEVAVESES